MHPLKSSIGSRFETTLNENYEKMLNNGEVSRLIANKALRGI